MKLRTASIAERDIVDASLWLDQQQFGSGADFQLAVRETAAAIAQAPLACPTLVVGDVRFRSTLRWRSVGRFPYVAILRPSYAHVLVCN
jgi:hypothetical protein